MQAIRKVFSNRVRKEAQVAAREFKRQYWQHFWRHSIDASSDAHLLEYTVAVVLLATAFTIAVSFFVGFSLQNSGAASSGDETEVMRGAIYRVASGFVFFAYVPLFIAPLYGMWVISLGLGVAVAKSDLARTSALVRLSSPMDADWELGVVKDIKRCVWSALKPLNKGWSRALGMQVGAAIVLAILTGASYFNDSLAAAGRAGIWPSSAGEGLDSFLFLVVSFAASALAIVLSLLPAFVNSRCSRLLRALKVKRLEMLATPMHASARDSTGGDSGRSGRFESLASSGRGMQLLEPALKVFLLCSALRDDEQFGFRLAGLKITPNSLRKVVAFIVLLYGIFYSVLDGSDQAQYMCVLMDEDGSGVE